MARLEDRAALLLLFDVWLQCLVLRPQELSKPKHRCVQLLQPRGVTFEMLVPLAGHELIQEMPGLVLVSNDVL
jgi:hypothetical protein